jgi:hypothetical protein
MKLTQVLPTMKMNRPPRTQVTIDHDNITLRSGNMEPVVIPRTALRTRLQLVDWTYRLTGWPGMTVEALRALIAAVFRQHGWTLSDPEDEMAVSKELSEAPKTSFSRRVVA